MIKHLIIFIIVFLYFDALFAEPIYRTNCIRNDIRTLQVYKSNPAEDIPLIALNSDQTIQIDFDHLSLNSEWISYKIIHCDAQWRRSNISEMEYLDGFSNIQITDVNPSFNTFTPYQHYHVSLPNDQIQFKISGNYAVLFYFDSEPDQIIATACFSIYEREITVQGQISTNTDISFNNEFEQLSIRLNWQNNLIINPANALQVIVTQNNRTDNAVTLTTPSQLNYHEAYFEHNPQLIFESGNNYRRIEFVSNRYAGVGVNKITYQAPIYHVYPIEAFPRANTPYYFDKDQNGRYVIRYSDAQDNNVEADYYLVHFSLNYPNPFLNGKIYLNGDFTYNRFDESTQMEYNKETNRYEKALLLKQGHYNYQFLYLPNQENKGKSNLIEGNFYENSNEYLVKVYYHELNQRYDRLMGFIWLRN